MTRCFGGFLIVLFFISLSLFLNESTFASQKNTISQDGRIALNVLTYNRQAITTGLNASQGAIREIRDIGLCYYKASKDSPANGPWASRREMNQDLAADIFAFSSANGQAVKKTSQFSYWSQGSLTRAAQRYIDEPRISGLLLAEVNLISAWRFASLKQAPVCQILKEWKRNNYKGIAALVDAFWGPGVLQKIIDLHWKSLQKTFIGAHVVEREVGREVAGLYLGVYSRSNNVYNESYRYLENF